MAQLAAHLICNQAVVGSSPTSSANKGEMKWSDL